MSRQRGRGSPRRLDRKKAALSERRAREKYPDFGPPLAAEKRAEIDRITVSKATLRGVRIKRGSWQPKRRRHKRDFQVRRRRPRFGELARIDGSPHAWLEGRGPRGTSIVLIDAASGKLMASRFALAATTRVYLDAPRDDVLGHGPPLAFASGPARDIPRQCLGIRQWRRRYGVWARHAKTAD